MCIQSVSNWIQSTWKISTRPCVPTEYICIFVYIRIVKIKTSPPSHTSQIFHWFIVLEKYKNDTAVHCYEQRWAEVFIAGLNFVLLLFDLPSFSEFLLILNDIFLLDFKCKLLKGKKDPVWNFCYPAAKIYLQGCHQIRKTSEWISMNITEKGNRSGTVREKK